MATTRFCRFDVEADAGAYKVAADERSQALYSEMFSAAWYPAHDIDGEWIVPLFGPPYQVGGVPVEETLELEALRVAAEIVDSVMWPPEDC